MFYSFVAFAKEASGTGIWEWMVARVQNTELGEQVGTYIR